MAKQYHFDKPKDYSKKYTKLRNMLLFAIIVSVIVFSIVYFVFLEKDVARTVARISKQTTQADDSNMLNVSNQTQNQTIECNEECLFKLALKTGDPSYCKNISNNSALKNNCINELAFTQKNISICNLLENESRIICIEKIAPPCMNVSKQDERELCLALKNNDSSYCSKVECFFSYAKERNSSLACDKLISEAEKYACVGVVKRTNQCSFLSGIYTLDYCYQLLAQYSKDFHYCDLITTGSYKFNCYLNASIEEKNKAYCAKNELEYIWNCYKEYSLAMQDVEGCFAISDYATNSKDGCLWSYALKFEEPSACNFLSTISLRINCYAEIVLQSTNLSVKKCSSIMAVNWKNKCFTNFAIQNKEKNICSYIEENSERQTCEKIFE